MQQLQKYLEINSIERLFDSKTAPELRAKATHIRMMTDIAMKLAEADESIDKDLLRICCMHHDDGLVEQFRQLNDFNDAHLSHHALGLDMLDRYIVLYNITMTPEIQILRACIYYHGRLQLAGNTLDDTTMKYVKLVSEADQIENTYFSPLWYMKRRIANDTFGYRMVHPEFNKTIRPELFEFYKTGQLFDDRSRSYSEILLEEATLVMEFIKDRGEFAKTILRLPCYGYGYISAADGYVDLFKNYMSKKDATLASQILLDALK